MTMGTTETNTVDVSIEPTNWEMTVGSVRLRISRAESDKLRRFPDGCFIAASERGWLVVAPTMDQLQQKAIGLAQRIEGLRRAEAEVDNRREAVESYSWHLGDPV